MNLNYIFNYTPVYIYVMASMQLFIGFSLTFSFGQILPLRTREVTYYLCSFLFLLVPFLYGIITGNVHSGTRSLLFYTAIFLAEFLFTKASCLKKLSLFFILSFFNAFIEAIFCSVYWKLICDKLLGLHYIPYINVPEQKLSTIIIFFFPIALSEISFNFHFPLLWMYYIRFIKLNTFVEIILLPVLCTNGSLLFFPELLGKAGWFLLFVVLFIASIFFLHAVTQIPFILEHIRQNQQKKELLERQISEYNDYLLQNNLLRKQNHDVNNHLQALSFLLSQNRIEDMKKYIAELLEK